MHEKIVAQAKTSDFWNEHIVLTRFDRFFAATLGRLIPEAVEPNHITLLRLFMIPPVLYYLYIGNYDVGVPLFLLAACTDAIDGSLARTRRRITDWGILYDPIADKLLIASVLFIIVLEHINFTLGLALIVVETVLIIGSVYAKFKKYDIQPANKWGKFKMFAECAGISLLLFALWSGIDLFVSLSNGTLAVALVAAIVSVLWRMR
jgi:cardiolipin synthase (CMP-forming)